jgi:hypothetical protein
MFRISSRLNVQGTMSLIRSDRIRTIDKPHGESLRRESDRPTRLSRNDGQALVALALPASSYDVNALQTRPRLLGVTGGDWNEV